MPKVLIAVFFGFGLVVFSASAFAGGLADTAGMSENCKVAVKRFKDAEPDPAVDPNAVVVLTYKYRFCPGKLTVKAGTKVQWVNVDKRTSHSVWIEEAGIEESERFFPDEGWSYTFTKAGEFPYRCGPHGIDEKMTALITVTP